MSKALTIESVRSGLNQIAACMADCRDELNTLDGQIGDGDLGITLANSTDQLREAAEGLPRDLGKALLECAKILTSSGASSYTTLIATGLMAVAKESVGREEIPWNEVYLLCDAALEKMSARGKSAVGDKTVLDALSAAS
jgi:dihydroxyacetone kinase-like protein